MTQPAIEAGDFAALVRRPGSSFEVLPVELPDIKTDEVRVRIVAVGMCHTDLLARDGKLPGVPMPSVLGHEGAGIIEEVGSGVEDLAPGDHVVLSFAFCGSCRHCADNRPADCDRFYAANFLGGEGRIRCHGESAPVNGEFFNQSSFATRSIVKGRHAVRVPRDIPLELLAPFGCGVITGAGTVLNYMKAGAGSSIAVFGAGAVGLSAVMAARLAGCATIIAVDVHPNRLDLAMELGATHRIDAHEGGLRSRIRAVLPGGADFVLDTTGVPDVIAEALGSVERRGAVVLVAGAPGRQISMDMSLLLTGASIRMVTEGAAVPREFIPVLIDHFRAGRFPVERLIRFYSFEDINHAAHEAELGIAIKPVLRVASEPRGVQSHE
jgi:aryl-alcohol dehydrogenase